MTGNLFASLPITQPAGLVYEPNFLSVQEELDLVRVIQSLPLQEMRYRDYFARRRIQSFGGQYDFSTNQLEPGPELIDALEPLRTRVSAWVNIEPAAFTQVLVAEYRTGTPLGWHRDVPDFEDIVGVSLLGTAEMRFRPHPPSHPFRGKALRLTLEPRSIYLLRGAARWGWQHSIAPVTELRYSITFRTGAVRSTT